MKIAVGSDHGGYELKKAVLVHLEKKGYAIDPETCKYKGSKLIAVYLKAEFGGFAVHLLQK